VEQHFAAPRYPVVDIASVERLLQYGCSARADYDVPGTPILRMNNLQESGWVLDDVKKVELAPRALDTWRLYRDDLVINRTNSKELVGKCEVFDLDGEWVFASYLMRLRVDVAEVLPMFLRDFLSTPAGRAQIDRDSRQIAGMTNINAEEVRGLRFPKPDRATQARLVGEMDAAREARRQKLGEANGLLAGLETFVLEQLGLSMPPPDARTAWAVRLQDDVRQRADANFHFPLFRSIQHRLKELGAVPLGTLCRLSEERVDPRQGEGSTFRYIEIGSVNAETGEASAVETLREDAPSRARMVVRAGDVIVSLTRPHRGSIALIGDSLDGCVASTGFAVLRNYDPQRARTTYLWACLRTQAARMQMLQRSSGGNYPAITEDELRNVLIPVPDETVQDRVVAEVNNRRLAATRLRADAARIWNDAKQYFEDQLLSRANKQTRGSN
jgi:restriction endonuclease S subunit